VARKHRNSTLESRTSRLKLAVRRKPYSGPSLARRVALLYRRNKTNGSWVLKASDGHGAYWTKAIAEADDHDESNGKTILNFFEAQDVAKKLARREDGSADTAPITVDDALNDYRRDLEARNANPYNADWPRLHLTSVLLSKPVALLAATELKKWRDSLLGAMAPSTINRLCRCCAPRWSWRRSTTSAFRIDRLGKLALLACRMRKRRATSSSPMTRCANSSPPLTGSMASLVCSQIHWRSLAHDQVRPSGYASRISTIIWCGRS
jgi:hypothetical protein